MEYILAAIEGSEKLVNDDYWINSNSPMEFWLIVTKMRYGFKNGDTGIRLWWMGRLLTEIHAKIIVCPELGRVWMSGLIGYNRHITSRSQSAVHYYWRLIQMGSEDEGWRWCELCGCAFLEMQARCCLYLGLTDMMGFSLILLRVQLWRSAGILMKCLKFFHPLGSILFNGIRLTVFNK
jgi:hypothetical protein